jgi:hypothetical protein
MAFCDIRDWEMNLNFDSSPTDPETLIFKLAAGGAGQVEVSNVRMSDLRWTCLPVGQFGQQRAKALLSFVFRFRRAGKEFGVMMAGFAHVNDINLVSFRGRFRTFTLDSKVPAAGGGELQVLALGDPGDTGTGTGTQT